eukprot:TRINITY_DN2408_c0_g1_i4.p1 TRINITY_DN2408_c0_g1~~TRINITY_DN2408_c0_g1_i4.p1  ORF type:complete len:329 (-),score=78.48 TRINITY_DN2408_c0_g1_i4:51-1037(-)
MPPRGDNKAERKQNFHAKLSKLLETYDSILVVNIDNIGSDHMQNVRKGIRGYGELICGKNTLIRRSVRLQAKRIPALEALLPSVYGNIALVFTKGSLSTVRDKLMQLKVEAPAKPGAIAPAEVTVPKGPTGLEPTKTSFLQALNIGSKINRGQIEIINDKVLIKAGDRVGPSEATLLSMLGIKPFSYAVSVVAVYDKGAVTNPSVLDITDDQVISQFKAGVQRIASLSLSIGYPTIASLPHSIVNGYKRVLAIALGTEYSFPRADKIRKALENPGAFVAAVEPAATTKTSAPPPEEKETKTDSKPEEPAEEEDLDLGGGGMFGGDDEW